MVLHAERRYLFVAQAGDGVVVQIAVRDLEAGRKRFFFDGKTVILGGDLDPSRQHIQYRLIRAAMTKLELKCLSAAGQSEQLMTEADAKDRNLAQNAANALLGIVQRLRIARAVAQKHTIRLM